GPLQVVPDANNSSLGPLRKVGRLLDRALPHATKKAPVFILPIWISKTNRIVGYVAISICDSRLFVRIRSRPPPEPRRVIARPVIVEPSLFVPFLACVAITFR